MEEEEGGEYIVVEMCGPCSDGKNVGRDSNEKKTKKKHSSSDVIVETAF
jgi:hypothetical protein